MSAGPILWALPSDEPVAVVTVGEHLVLAHGADAVLHVPVAEAAPDVFARVDALAPGWWAGFVTYDLGRAVERVVTRRPRSARPEPDVCFVRFAARVAIDRRTGAPGRVVGAGAAAKALQRAVDHPAPVPAPRPSGPWRTSLTRHEYEAGAREVIELIEAGECYQVNLTRRLSAPRRTDPIALHHALVSRNPAPHSAFFRYGETTVVSASPERFLRVDGRAVETRPIKGTARSASALRSSAKDHAENVMIVDLARNDLGRVCVPGTISVPRLFDVEAHPGLVHLVSTVRGVLRPEVGVGGLLRATMPAASITGAPKPRVLQAIEDLEPVRRGVYCGAIGWIDTERARADLAVAIRTFAFVEDQVHLGVGSGITIDSDPRAEWEETELKAQRLLATAGATASPAPATHAAAAGGSAPWG